MGSFLSRLWWGPEPAKKPGGVDRKGSHPAEYDEWRPQYYEPEVKKPVEPPVVRPEPEIIQKATPEVTELQRVHETKLEREKITNDFGSTTEKTQYTQYTESTRIQECKGPVEEPFDSSTQHTVFPTFTELKTSGNTSPTSDEKRHEIYISAPKEADVDETQEGEKTEEEKEDAVVKIQAGVRGYLTRKALKERSVTPEPIPRPPSEELIQKVISKDVQAVPHPSSPTELKKESPIPSPLTQPEAEPSGQEQEEDSAGAEEAATKIQAAFRGYKVRKQGRPEPPARKNNQKIVVDLDDDEEEEEEEEEEDEEESDEGTVSESDEE